MQFNTPEIVETLEIMGNVATFFAGNLYMMFESVFGGLFLEVADLFKTLTDVDEKKMVLFGATGVGKTALLYKMKMKTVKLVSTIPTIGFNVETIKFKGTNFTIWDVGGQEKLIPLWKHYVQNVSCAMFLINASRKDQLEYYAKLLKDVVEDFRNYNSLSHDEEGKMKIMVLSNIFDKNDIQINVMDFAEEVSVKTKFLGKIMGIECSVLEEKSETLTKLICEFF